MKSSQAQQILDQARRLLYEKAMVKINGQYVGTVAAIPQSDHHDLNYTEVFIRDNVPVMIFLLLQNETEIVQNFLEICLTLQSKGFPTYGIFPTSFVETENHELKADYGQRAIGRVCSVDASLWWPILAYYYVQRTGNEAWARQTHVQLGLQKFLNLILHPVFRDAPTLFVPDGAFMIDRPMDVWGAPLEIQTLLYGALKSAAGLLLIDLKAKGYSSHHDHPFDSFTVEQSHQFDLSVDWLKKLRTYLLKHYWINCNIVQTLRRRPTEQYGEEASNEHNVHTETIPNWLQDWLGDRGGYLIGNIRTGRPDFRFFSLGNCLGAIFDVTSLAQQRSFFRLVLNNQRELCAQMPLRICHPPLKDDDWRSKTGFDRKNLPWCYHNAGHWPCLFWFLVVAVLRHSCHSHYGTVEYAEMGNLIRNNYEVLLRRLPKHKWAEYFDGPTGFWVGQQSRSYQTWTIVGLLLVHHFTEVNPDDALMFDLPSLKSLHQALH
ncbi:glycoside hydrolase 100 family protein [Synechocystis salina LEGE 06155]|nr:glycoside hydrolase 100 family protein [Synechocystis salina LEGE 06155]